MPHRITKIHGLKENGFIKQERIVSQKLINELFTGGQSHSTTAFPLRVSYLLQDLPQADAEKNDVKVQLLISVPKRRFKHAVDRNRVKRQLREAYRNNKQLLSQHVLDGKKLALAFVWLSDRHFPTAEVERRVVGLLQHIAHKL